MNTSDREKPPRVPPRLKQAPKIRDMLWCDFPKDAQLPELWKRRPVIVIAADRTLGGAVTVIPCSSKPQDGNRWAFRLATPIDGIGPSWAICDKPTTVAVSRLSLEGNARKRLPEKEFTAVLTLMLTRLPSLKRAALPRPSAEAEQVLPAVHQLDPE